MYTLAELAYHLDGCLHGNAKQSIRGIASLSRATSSDLTYFENIVMLQLLDKTQAGVVLLTARHVHYCPVNSIVVANPLESMTRAAELFVPTIKHQEGIHPKALISPTALLGEQVTVGAGTVIADSVKLGDGVKIAANSVIEEGVEIGPHTRIGSGVYIHSGSKLGAHVVIENGAVLGASPFNSVKKQGRWHSGAAFGGVVIEDYVQLGANTVVARGSLGDTYICEGVHIDNLVQIAHDVTIGKHSAIAGCAAIGAYTQIGEDCIVGGASCIAAHVHLADDVVITGMSTVSKSLSKAGVYSSGIIVSEHQQWRRNAARFRRLDDYIIRLARLEKEYSKNKEHSSQN
ncbi:UDP-3-O-[3-hydroxymyristoyl] glucosamine N-acyltransferase [Legionella nautarum]|uniref:UDP-3-O-acylglucosamine N-acyltransferase n=1 Tax=Legionella nautarum TaxID=45070 RepID=A0A0W0X2T3_9GAMM|nr:UDP-3-O-(3-hydroxymyristoyl)glucosamine N-acyltransferase [Legionella nautarum]KTD38875.1 UDP-3-O-[3-hydroxymyristoyl] glucosamine N-acyltransferase [Legionella nautarum]